MLSWVMGFQAETPLSSFPSNTHAHVLLFWSLSPGRRRLKAPGKACLGSRLGAGPHPRQDSWVDDSYAAPPPSLPPRWLYKRQQETGWRLQMPECLHLHPNLLLPTPHNLLGSFPAFFLGASRASGAVWNQGSGQTVWFQSSEPQFAGQRRGLCLPKRNWRRKAESDGGISQAHKAEVLLPSGRGLCTRQLPGLPTSVGTGREVWAHGHQSSLLRTRIAKAREAPCPMAGEGHVRA